MTNAMNVGIVATMLMTAHGMTFIIFLPPSEGLNSASVQTSLQHKWTRYEDSNALKVYKLLWEL